MYSFRALLWSCGRRTLHPNNAGGRITSGFHRTCRPSVRRHEVRSEPHAGRAASNTTVITTCNADFLSLCVLSCLSMTASYRCIGWGSSGVTQYYSRLASARTHRCTPTVAAEVSRVFFFPPGRPWSGRGQCDTLLTSRGSPLFFPMSYVEEC